jgi:hypothetical protein
MADGIRIRRRGGSPYLSTEGLLFAHKFRREEPMTWCRNRAILSLLAVTGGLALAACGGRASPTEAVGASPDPTFTSAQPTPSATFEGGSCNCTVGTPIANCDSPTQQLDFVNPPTDKLPHTVLGIGPVYWGGQPVWHTAGEQGVVLVDPVVVTPVTVTFTGPHAGDSATLGGKASVTIQPVAHGWAFADDQFVPSGAGCWTMQATYGTHTILVKFTVVSGEPPPA